MNSRLVTGIAFSREETLISLSGMPQKIGLEGYLLGKLAAANIEVDMIAQNATGQNSVDFTFTMQRREHSKALKLIEELSTEWGAITLRTNPKVAKISLVGIGMRSHTGVAETMFKALGDAGISIQMITTSEIKISVVVDEIHLEQGVKAIHQAFELDKLPESSKHAFIE